MHLIGCSVLNVIKNDIIVVYFIIVCSYHVLYKILFNYNYDDKIKHLIYIYKKKKK
jgi:hypothetical protein